MARQPRDNPDGAITHVWARGNDRRRIFADDLDRKTYLLILADVCKQFGWGRLGYCLMDNHVHLLLETPEANLSEGMQRLQNRYAKRFNFRHEKTGHLFGSRFGSRLIETDEQLIAVTSYIENNPVEAGLCASPGEWAWTNCALAKKLCEASVYGLAGRAA